MRFHPIKCPVCGQLASGTEETVPGSAQIDADADGNAEYSGETKMWWDGQETVCDDGFHVRLTCHNGHDWEAIRTDAEAVHRHIQETVDQYGIYLSHEFQCQIDDLVESLLNHLYEEFHSGSKEED